MERYIIAGIASLIKYADQTLKKMIMSRYYHFFNYYIDCPEKKMKWLQRKQVKNLYVSDKLDRSYLKFIRKKVK